MPLGPQPRAVAPSFLCVGGRGGCGGDVTVEVFLLSLLPRLVHWRTALGLGEQRAGLNEVVYSYENGLLSVGDIPCSA